MRNSGLGRMAGAAGPGLAVTAGSVFGVGLNLVLPFVLPMAEYALYSLLLGLAQVVTSLAFEWMRLVLLRHGYGANLVLASLRRMALAWAYVVTAGGLLALAGVAAVLSMWLDWALAAAAVLACAAIQGAFDGQMAAARARFDNRAFVARWVLRAVLGLVLAVTAAAIFRSGIAALVGLALSYPLAALLWLERLPRWWRVDKAELGSLFRFGAAAAIGSNFSAVVPAVVRSLVVASLGLAGSGGVLLAVDIGQRLFSIIGMSINVVAVQNAIAAVERADGDAIRARVRDVVVLPLAVIGPMAIGFLALQPQIAALIVPDEYRAGFDAGAWAVVLAAALQSVRHYGVDPLFLIFGRPGRAFLAPGLVLALLLVAGFVPAEIWGGAIAAAVIPLLVANVAGVVAAILALRGLVPWPLTVLLRLGLALTAMAGVASVLPNDGGLGQAVLNVMALSLTYGGALVLLDIRKMRPRREAVAG